MRDIKYLLDFYINSSIHVALSVFSLVKMTQFMFSISNDSCVGYFAFFGTIVGYNFVKYDALARSQKLQMRKQLKAITLVSFLALVVAVYFFFQLQNVTKGIGIFFFVLTLIYTLPFFPNKKNARNWAGIKIYIVALCWVGVTLVLPIINAEIEITSDFYLKCIQRFIVVFVLILIFEILDIKNDDPHLQTVPQQIGVKKTKVLGYFLLLIFCVLELFNSNFKTSLKPFLLVVLVAIMVALFLYFVNEQKSKYYTSFWVESVPIFWWLLLFF
jgi:hypothetical protein